MAEITKKEAVKLRTEEIIKCGKDPLHFINHYCYIQEPVKGRIRFKTYDFQDKCVKDFLEHKYNIVLKSRQLGLSTITAAYCLWYALFYKDKNVLVIATQMDVAKNFIQKVKFILSNLPSWIIIPTLTANSTKEIAFNNGSKVVATPTSDNAGRSHALSLLVVDEAAHIERMDELWMGLYNTLATGGRAILLSTPNGCSGHFHKTWINSEKGLNNFNRIFLPWTVHPERDEEWFKDQCKNLDQKGIAQELLADFVASGDSFLTQEDLAWMGQMIKQPIERSGPDFNMYIWEYPLPGRKYIVGADSCRGDGDDFATFTVVDTESDQVVADYRGKLTPDKFAEFLYEVGTTYNTALLAPENNNYGFATCSKLKQMGYPNLYYEKMPGSFYMESYVSADSDLAPGFHMDVKKRPLILAKLAELLRNKRVKIYSSRLYEEAKTFIWKNNKPQAQKGYHDDLLISAAITFWLYEVAEGYNKHSDGLSQALLAGMSRQSKVLNKINGADDGLPIIRASLDSVQNKNRINQSMAESIYGQFNWVLKDK